MASALAASARGASYLILVQVVSRGLTFSLNQVLLRFLSPELLGAATQLELYSISVLYFARESLRVSLQRETGNLQAIVNASYISILLGIPLAYVLAVIYQQSALPHVPFMSESLYLYGLASIVELLSEPLFAITQQKFQYRTRALAETVAAMFRGLVTFSTVSWCHLHSQEPGVLPFAFGQVTYAACLLSVYYYCTVAVAKAESISLFPKQIDPIPKKKGDAPADVPNQQAPNYQAAYVLSYFPRALITLAMHVYLQSGIKYILTQGDSLLISILATLSEQGAYALASNYGSLIARMLFQPIEESSRNLFAKLSTSRAQPKGTISRQNNTQARSTLCDIMKFYNIMALVSWSIGPSIAPLLLQIVAGSKWSYTSAPGVLAIYCYYIPLLALNGVTEAFVAAVADNRELKTQSLFMGVYSFVFASAAYMFLNVMGLGAKGLVWANCVNMICRIVWNIRFVNNYFTVHDGKSFDVTATMPTLSSCAVAACVSNALVMARKMKPSNSLLHRFILDGSMSAICVIVLLLLERDFVTKWFRVIFPRKHAPK